MTAHESPTLVTLSFSGDLECCRVLCETADRFAPAGARHMLAVPAADMALFRPLSGARRSLVAQEDLLPPWLRRLPLPGPAWRRRLGLPRRNVYLSLRGRPVRGWIAQQIMKINAAAGAPSDTVLHLDSDTALIRPLPAAALGAPGRVRLARFPGAARDAMHAPWHRTAARLLGLAPSDYHGADYIDQFVTWRRANVRGLLAHVARATGRDPIAALAASRDLSEYILYGVYCERVLGLDAAGHAATDESLCETVWTGDAAPAPTAGRYGLGIQSTIALAAEARRALVARAIAQAAGVESAGVEAAGAA